MLVTLVLGLISTEYGLPFNTTPPREQVIEYESFVPDTGCQQFFRDTKALTSCEQTWAP
jgi:hypothetical protein